MKINHFTRGFSLVEILIALVIFAFSMAVLLENLNASLYIVGKQNATMQNTLLISRALSLIELLKWQALKENENKEGKEQQSTLELFQKLNLPRTPWIDEELESIEPEVRKRSIQLNIPDFPQMSVEVIRLEKRNIHARDETLAKTTFITEDSLVMENYKKLLSAGKKHDQTDKD